MIVTLEGASAVGKTTVGRALTERIGAYVVPEVNALFSRPPKEHPNWYFDRQVDRWRIAEERAADHRAAVLDGDVLQPLWYNWTFEFAGFQPLESVAAFYRPLIEGGFVGFPTMYVLLLASEDELRRRKEADATRSRRNFEAHLRLVASQSAYFGAMASMAPGLVRFVQANEPETTVQSVLNEAEKRFDPVPPLDLFDEMVNWLSRNAPSG